MTNGLEIVDNIVDTPKQEGEKDTRTVIGIEKNKRDHYYYMEWSGGHEM